MLVSERRGRAVDKDWPDVVRDALVVGMSMVVVEVLMVLGEVVNLSVAVAVLAVADA